MSNAIQLNKFTDFDRLLIGRNFIITLLGSALAFFLAYYQIYVPLPIIPYNLSLAIGVMIFVAVATKNIASSGIVGIIGSIGIIAPDGGMVDFVFAYIGINFLLVLTLAYLSDRLQLVMSWTRFYLAFAAVFSTISIMIGILWYPYNSSYNQTSLDIGTGGDLGTNIGIPILDLAVLGILLLFIIIFTFLLRGQILLGENSVGKYRNFGLLFLVLGQLVTIVPLLLYSIIVKENALQAIAVNDYHLVFLREVFFHGNTYGLIGGPVSIFFIMAITTTLTCIGLSLLLIAKHQGNLEGTTGGSEIAFLAAPIVLVFYFVFASYYVQSFLAPAGLFISVELFPFFASAIWMVYYLNQVLARVLLFVYDRF